jgi:hypothetical protein
MFENFKIEEVNLVMVFKHKTENYLKMAYVEFEKKDKITLLKHIDLKSFKDHNELIFG